MKLLITGAGGMLGSDLLPLFAAAHDLTATDLATLDVRDAAAVRQAVRATGAEAVLHLAALTNVDQCEKEPAEAYRTNTLGTRNVALACQAAGIPLVYISTLSVFSGTKPEPYHEYDQPAPASAYSNAKYQGEVIVQSLLQRYYIVRAGWMFGGGMEDKKFVAKIIELARQRSELTVVDDKFGSPTYTQDLARFLLHLLPTGLYGLYHGVNSGPAVSRYELAQAILADAAITTCTVKPVSSACFPLPAPRPRMEAGINLAARLSGLTEPPPWRESLRHYIQQRLLAQS
jgi:dTDP-4-dehydrorhamnose reductase